MSSRRYPKITVITVVKDRRDGLIATQKSIFSQTSTNFEWLVVDGFSSDGTEVVLGELDSKPRIRIFRQTPRGIYHAMNFAAQKAKGEFIWFLNAGDFFLSSESVADVIKLMKSKSDISMFATSVLYFSKTHYVYDVKLPSIRLINGYKVADFHHQGVILKNTLFKKVGSFDETLRLAADGKMLDMCLNHVEPYLSRDPFVGFEMGGDSSRYFRRSLVEARSYRPTELGSISVAYLQLKNLVRNSILLAESSTLTKFMVLPILKWKMKRLSLAHGELMPSNLDKSIY